MNAMYMKVRNFLNQFVSYSSPGWYIHHLLLQQLRLDRVSWSGERLLSTLRDEIVAGPACFASPQRSSQWSLQRSQVLELHSAAETTCKTWGAYWWWWWCSSCSTAVIECWWIYICNTVVIYVTGWAISPTRELFLFFRFSHATHKITIGGGEIGEALEVGLQWAELPRRTARTALSCCLHELLHSILKQRSWKWKRATRVTRQIKRKNKTMTARAIEKQVRRIQEGGVVANTACIMATDASNNKTKPIKVVESKREQFMNENWLLIHHGQWQLIVKREWGCFQYE